MKVRVYYNLHKKKLSVLHKINGAWLVVAHKNEIHLTDVKFRVSEAGRQRVIKNKRKNVHAFIEGTEVDSFKMSYQLWFTMVSYNPFKLERFHDGESYVDKADLVYIKDKLIYSVNAR